jgi:hypothetical protein
VCVLTVSVSLLTAAVGATDTNYQRPDGTFYTYAEAFYDDSGSGGIVAECVLATMALSTTLAIPTHRHNPHHPHKSHTPTHPHPLIRSHPSIAVVACVRCSALRVSCTVRLVYCASL